MRIKFTDTGEEYQISGIPASGNSVAGGRYISKQGIICEGVEDITEYDAKGVEIIPGEVAIVYPTMSNTVAEIKAFMGTYMIPYNSGDTKGDLLQKIELFFG